MVHIIYKLTQYMSKLLVTALPERSFVILKETYPKRIYPSPSGQPVAVVALQ